MRLKCSSLDRRVRWVFLSRNAFLRRVHRDAQCVHLQQHEAPLCLCLLHCSSNTRVKRDQPVPHSRWDLICHRRFQLSAQSQVRPPRLLSGRTRRTLSTGIQMAYWWWTDEARRLRMMMISCNHSSGEKKWDVGRPLIDLKPRFFTCLNTLNVVLFKPPTSLNVNRDQ